jgi:hypothetical protein
VAARTTAPARAPRDRKATRTSAADRPTTRRTGQTNNWATASVGNNKYADVNGNVYHNNGSGLAAALVERLERRVGRHLVGGPRIAGAKLG